MTTYTVQRHDPSGEQHALRYNDANEITGVSEALPHREVESIRQSPSILAHIDYEPDDSVWANSQNWGAPVVEYPAK